MDPVIQFPTNSQSLNPYSYIMNNPMAGTDPTGYLLKFVMHGKESCLGGEECEKGRAFDGPIRDLLSSLTSGGAPKHDFSNGLDNGSILPKDFNGTVIVGDISTVTPTGMTSAVPNKSLSISLEEYLKDPRAFWESIPLSAVGYASDADVKEARNGVNSREATTNGDITSIDAQRDFVRQIAKVTSIAQEQIIRDSKVKSEFYLELSSNGSGGFIIVGAQRIPLQGAEFNRTPGSSFAVHWHYAGLTSYPGPGDHSPPKDSGIPGFVVTRDVRKSRCCNIYEVGRQGNSYLYRNTTQEPPGTWKSNPNWKSEEIQK